MKSVSVDTVHTVLDIQYLPLAESSQSHDGYESQKTSPKYRAILKVKQLPRIIVTHFFPP